MSAGFQTDAFQVDAFQAGSPDTVPSYARMLFDLLPPGRIWRRIGSVLERLLLGCAEELGRIDERVVDLLDESDPATAMELLPEHEGELGLASTGTLEERRARVIARLTATVGFRPEDFQDALAMLLGQAPMDVVVIERTHAQAVAFGDDREIFRFFIYRDPMLPGTYFLDSAQAQVDVMKPSHTIGHVIESVNFLCDDPFSLCDRDLLGA